jgi:hypothetical protein
MARRSGAWRTRKLYYVVADHFSVRHLISQERLPFTATYFGSIGLTLYFAVGVSSRPFSSVMRPPRRCSLRSVGPDRKCEYSPSESSRQLADPHPPIDNHGAKAAVAAESLLADQLALSQLRSTILTLLTSLVQVVALIWYLVSYFPMGSQGLRIAASFGGNRIAAWMRD